MKHLKTYENLRKPRIGDYVIIDPYTHPEQVDDWIMNHIGKIIDIRILDDKKMYIVKYEDIPKGWEGHFSDGEEKNIRKTYEFGIEHFSRNKKDLERILAANKYNI